MLDGTFNSITEAAGVVAPSILKALGLFRHRDVADGDRIYLRNYGERLPVRGGYWYDGANAGVRALSLNYPRSYLYSPVGARPAFVL
ncbi:hypothetical protein D3C78_1391670 [compost metagenome]